MATMIPPVISPDVKSNAEKKIFRWFKEAPRTDDWVVLHSLGIASHSNQMSGEADFVVLAPRLGMFVLEVKGGIVSRGQGVWKFTNRYGETTTKPKSPFAQASDAAFDIVEKVKGHRGDDFRHLDGVLFGHGVMFPDMDFAANGVEEEQWQVFDARDGKDVASYIERLSSNYLRRWREVYGHSKRCRLNDRDVRHVVSLLRGDFEGVISFSAQIRDASDEILRLTGEQYRCLDQLEDNPRCLIQGSAGTGKTLIAVKKAMEDAAAGHRVALLCFNANLAEWLNRAFDEMPDAVRPAYVGTFHKFMLDVCKEEGAIPSQAEGDEAAFYQKQLPEAAALALLEPKHFEPFDRLVIDEAQDLMLDEYLQVMDFALKRTLARGSWFMFGDLSRQAIYANGETSESMKDRLEEHGSYARYTLTVNCRNTKPICDEVEIIARADKKSGSCLKVGGLPVEYLIWKNDAEQLEKLESLIDRLLAANVAPREITILSPRKRENSIVSLVTRHRIRDYDPLKSKGITFSTIQAYKGLENTVIILADIDSVSAEQIMYVGFSRARAALYVLESKEAKKEHDRLVMERMLG